MTPRAFGVAGGIVAVALALALAAPRPRPGLPRTAPPHAATAPRSPAAPPYVEPLSAAHLEVIDKIHRQGLANDPEVAEAMREHVRRYQTGGTTRAEAAAEFARWLRVWEAANPARAAAARARYQAR